MHLWSLLVQWSPDDEQGHWRLEGPLSPGAEVPSAHVWLVQRLEALGLERCEELELIGGEDLYPVLDQWSGAGAWELDALCVELPRLWRYQGGLYRCEVQVRARRVWLEPADAVAKRAKEPPRDVLPRFRGFTVMYRQASRVLELRR
jgi:hypothetical protein